MATAHWIETYSNMSDEELRQESQKLAAQLEQLQSSLDAETNKDKQATYKIQILNLRGQFLLLQSIIRNRQQ